MANLIEEAVWEAGIRQIETTDPVIGGPPNPATGAGLSNIQAFQLARRTAWLRAQFEALASDFASLGIDDVGGLTDALALLAPKASPAFSGTPTAPTPAQFDADTSVANTEFVQRALGNMRGGVALAGSTTLGASHVGHNIILNGGGVITLPAASSVPSGSVICLFVTSPGWSVTRAGTDLVNLGFGSFSTRALGQGDHLVLVSDGLSTWNAIGGAAQLAGASVFGSSLAASGWQRLPSGLIIQWGQAVLPSSGSVTSQVTVSLPTAFPNLHVTSLAAVANTSHSTNGGWPPVSVDSHTLTSFRAVADVLLQNSLAFNRTVPLRYISIGY